MSRPAIRASSLRAYGLPGDGGTRAKLEVSVGAATDVALPDIGFELDTSSELPTASTIERIRGLRPSHIRVEIDLTADSIPNGTESALGAVRSIGAALELVLAGIEGASEQTLAAAIASVPAELDIARIIVLGDGVWPARPEERHRVLAALPRDRRDASVLAGSRDNFDIVNRDWASVVDADGVAFGIQPQWHAVDDLSVIETLEGQFYAARTARREMGTRTVAISPVTLGPDYAGIVGDPRHRSLFGAAWTIGSVESLSRAGADSATYYRLLGPAGVMGPDRPDAADGSGSTGPVYPCFHVFADLAGAGRAHLREITIDGQYPATAIALEHAGAQLILIGSFAPVPVDITITGLGGGAWRLRTLDRETADRALYEPAAFQEAWTSASPGGDSMQQAIGPYGLLTLARDTDGRA
jgi:hypothetical protein